MLRFILKRLLSVIPVFIVISILLFAIVKMMPGDPVKMMIPRGIKKEQYDKMYAQYKEQLGLNKKLPEQYFRWMGNMLTGKFGESSMYNKPVAKVIWEPMRNTLYLNIFALILQLSIMIPVGIRMARKRGSLFDRGWQVFSLFTYSMPSFFIALILIYFLAIKFGMFPISGMPNNYLLNGAWEKLIAWFRYAALPAITLTLISLAATIRYVRTSMIDALSQDYVRTARAKGLSERQVVYSHAFRNALIPLATVVIASVFGLFIGSPITETVFAWHGIGRVLVNAVSNRDFALVMTVNWIFAIMAVMGNLAADIAYGLIDPRIKL